MQHRIGFIGITTFVLVLGSLCVQAQSEPSKQSSNTPPAAIPNPFPQFPALIPAKPLYDLDKAMLKWPLPASERKYADIEGEHLKAYVNELVDISRRSKARGEQLWGRIMGTRADKETEEWLLARYRAAGLSNVHSESIDLVPQWFPTWSITAKSDSKQIALETAQPIAGETSSGPVDVEAVWVGLGDPVDFEGRDVRGKAVFIYAIPYPGVWRQSAGINHAVERATEKGAAAVVTIIGLPGNIRTQRGLRRAGSIPQFSLGTQDGNALRELIENSPPHSVHVNIRLEGKEVSGLKTANVWAELPGMTDEKIIILAHRDGYFYGASDNASGVATMVGLAEHFAKIPQKLRRRTIVFIGTPGHHGNVGLLGAKSLLREKDTVLGKTALLINSEHTAAIQTYLYGFGPDGGPMIRMANTLQAFWWYAGGSKAFVDLVVSAFDTFGVPTYENPDAYAQGEMGEIYKFAPSVQLIEANMLYHSDHETPETVPATALAQSTRAYAKIIDDVNKHSREELMPRQATTSP
jgi:hypothetical protein